MDVTSLFNHSPVEGQLGCIQFEAIRNKAAMNISVTGLSMNISFHFSGVNDQNCSCQAVW